MGNAPPIADWIAVDWGTTHLRAWAMDKTGTVLAGDRSKSGMSRLARADFEPALLRLVAPWLGTRRTRVVACGMVGSRQGWAEAPYRTAPCAAAPDALIAAPAHDPRLDMRLIPGIRQSDPADVMRGEETQIAGFLAARPDFDGILCLPGTHSKWVHVSAGEVVSFRTFMTGELFALLAHRSVLRHSVAADGWDDAAFLGAVADALSRPESVAARLFSLRAETLVGDLTPQTARARLSGMLIGMELAAARPYWLGQNIELIGATALCRIYAAALAAQGADPDSNDGERMTIAGLTAAHSQTRELT